jgi:hypothetical protein
MESRLLARLGHGADTMGAYIATAGIAGRVGGSGRGSRLETHRCQDRNQTYRLHGGGSASQPRWRNTRVRRFGLLRLANACREPRVQCKWPRKFNFLPSASANQEVASAVRAVALVGVPQGVRREAPARLAMKPARLGPTSSTRISRVVCIAMTNATSTLLASAIIAAE